MTSSGPAYIRSLESQRSTRSGARLVLPWLPRPCSYRASHALAESHSAYKTACVLLLQEWKVYCTSVLRSSTDKESATSIPSNVVGPNTQILPIQHQVLTKTISLPRYTCSISTTPQNTMIVLYMTNHKHESRIGTDINTTVGMSQHISIKISYYPCVASFDFWCSSHLVKNRTYKLAPAIATDQDQVHRLYGTLVLVVICDQCIFMYVRTFIVLNVGFSGRDWKCHVVKIPVFSVVQSTSPPLLSPSLPPGT